jgi:hypothetical protein
MQRYTYNGTSPAFGTMTSWKQILLKSLGVGVGIGVGLGICVALYAWHASRPVPQRPWDANAITATFEHVDTVGENHHIRFTYNMENHTDLDYKIQTASLQVSALIGPDNSLLAGGGQVKFQDDSVFLPAKQRLLFSLELPGYIYSGSVAQDSPEELKNYRDAVQKYVYNDFPHLNGFAVFDEINRYRINFPNGWKPTKSN